MKTLAKKSKIASLKLASLDNKTKNRILNDIAKELQKNKKQILVQNKKDITAATKTKLKTSLINRLKIDEGKFSEIVNMIRSVAKLKDPCGQILAATELDKNLILKKVSCPIGVLCAIFESRPDAVTQISSLAIKSGNAIILKGGSEAKNSNKILVAIVRCVLKKYGVVDAVQLVETRADVGKLLKLDDYIDLIIPRGSNAFVKYIQDNTKIAVLGHSDGICHVYVDDQANLAKALNICLDSKIQYAAACNAVETILINKKIAQKFLSKLIKKFQDNNIEVRGDQQARKIVKSIKQAVAKDWQTEYNDLVVSVKIVKNIDEAINHINQYGSGHTDSIITANKKKADLFMGKVDSACVFANCSTRFSDGYRFGLGSEVGISTNKLHARGPVGLEGLVIYKYKLFGDGQVVGDYSGVGGLKFSHKKL